MTALSPHLQSRLDRELDEGESVRWVAQPIARVLKRDLFEQVRALVYLFGAFTVMLLAFSIAEQLFDITEEDSLVTLYALTVACFFFSFAPYIGVVIASKRIARNTIYAVTQKRAIILVVHGNQSISERDYRGDELIHLARREYPDGTGSITFESARGAGTSIQTTSRHRFLGIEKVIEVERMLRDQFGES